MIYSQSTGILTTDDKKYIGSGYSGFASGKNNPLMESVRNIGPIPKGIYSIGKSYNSKKTGPLTIPLVPNPKNNMYDRSLFAIHGDNINMPGTASHGCIILSRKIREYIVNSIDKILKVV